MNAFRDWKPHDADAHNKRVAMRGVLTSEGDQELRREAVNRESDLHNQIFNECRRRGWIALHGAMSERTHRNPGEWDFTIVADHGRVFFVECKTAAGKLSQEQRALIAWAEKLGHAVHVVRSMEEFLNLI